MSAPITRMMVVVPSRDEAALLPATLASLEQAKVFFNANTPHVSVTVTVALDNTTDSSLELVSAYPDIQLVLLESGKVGAVRNAGIAAAWMVNPVPPEQIWILNTDADSEVPLHWLQKHFDLACEGAHVVAGTVEPNASDVPKSLREKWWGRHDLREGHPHVHGANLGFLGSVFTGLGGFSEQGLHEDRDLVAMARARGYNVVASDSCRVTTSGRLQSKIAGGFADFLAALE